jgi:hypothetical protein
MVQFVFTDEGWYILGFHRESFGVWQFLQHRNHQQQFGELDRFMKHSANQTWHQRVITSVMFDRVIIAMESSKSHRKGTLLFLGFFKSY